MGEYEDTIESALASIPQSLTARLGTIRFNLDPSLGELSSRWTREDDGLRVDLAMEDTSPHDCAIELLTCLGQAVWESASSGAHQTWLQLLRAEIDANVTGEIDEVALIEKGLMLSSPLLARSRRHLEKYATAAFAGTLAEYVHSLWHDVTLREGEDYLPAAWLERRFAMLRRWFPAEVPGRSRSTRHACRRRGA